MRQLKGHKSHVSSVVISPGGEFLASGKREALLLIRFMGQDRQTLGYKEGNEIRYLEGHKYSVQSVAFSPVGELLASGGGKYFGGGDNSIRLWDLKSGVELRQLKGHENTVGSTTFSPTGEFLASGK